MVIQYRLELLGLSRPRTSSLTMGFHMPDFTTCILPWTGLRTISKRSEVIRDDIWREYMCRGGDAPLHSQGRQRGHLPVQ